MKKLFIPLCLLCFQAFGQNSMVTILPSDDMSTIIRKAATVTPSPRQLRWQKLELTAFFHFGINTYTNREWGDGKEDISIFNPTQLSAEQWVKTIKDAGFKQAIITAKHHDGFCLWPTKFTEHSIKNTPYKNGKGDIVKEVADACKKYNIGFGVYLSPWDRNNPAYGTDAYNAYFKNQLTELLTEYGKVDEVWLDGANGEGPNGKKQVYDFNGWYTLIRQLQPQAVIAVQGPDARWVGTETGVGRETEWSVLPIAEKNQERIAALSQKDVNIKPSLKGSTKDRDRGSRSKLIGANGLVWYPAETDVSIRPGWFYHPNEDDKVKTPEKLMDIYFTSVGRNGVLLLNIPPNTQGLISETDVKSLASFARKMKSTFSNNLAKTANISSSNGVDLKKIVDGKLTSYFTTTKQDTTTTIEFNWQNEISFNVLSLQENIAIGQRVEEFEADYFNGKEWSKFTWGTTIGYKRLLKFNTITTKKVRFRILSSRLNPTIAEFGLYNLVEAD